MIEKGAKGKLIAVTGKYDARMIYSNTFGNIGETGLHEMGDHFGIKVGDMVFDNLRTKGIPYGQWLDDLGGKTFNIIEELPLTDALKLPRHI